MNVLSKWKKECIMGHTSKRFRDVRMRSMSPYYERILSCNSLFCFKCSNEILVGTEYQKVYSKNTGSKYYHGKCHESLYL